MLAACTLTPSAIKADIVARLLDQGFDVVRIASPSLTQRTQDEFRQFIAKGLHGDMGWLARRINRHIDPQNLWNEAKSIIMLGMNYGPQHNPLDENNASDHGVISVYARNNDYHDVMKKRLRIVTRQLCEDHKAQAKFFVDTAPLAEKPLAEQSGIGWQGKHTNLVSKDFGSWLFLGAILTDLDLPNDYAHDDHCGSCTACIDICPTNAIRNPHRLDARLCISYLTIEHADTIPWHVREAMGNRIYGCDDCLAICPWNKYATISNHADFHARAELANPALVDLLQLDDTNFRQLFTKSPIKRIGIARFLRNCLIAAGNSNNKDLAKIVQPLLHASDEIVRATSIWALAKLLNAPQFAKIYRQHAKSSDTNVIMREWQYAITYIHPTLAHLQIQGSMT